MNWLALLYAALRAALMPRAALIAENMALRQQLAVFKRLTLRPRLKLRDRLFWVLLTRAWRDWRSALAIVEPDTVCRWHRAGFRLFWRRKSRGGRPRKERELRRLIRRLARENPLWGAPRMRAELQLLGHCVSEATVRKYLPQPAGGPRRRGSPSWRAFWKNH